MEPFEKLLESSAAAHGHICPGQIVGVRMAMLGCRLIGLDDPDSPGQIKKIIVYVEMDRCTADAVAHVTGVKLGRRSLKFKDYGVMAATFVNLETNKAVRILSTDESRNLCSSYVPELTGREQMMKAYLIMPDSVMFRAQEVRVDINELDLPGPTKRKISCSKCGQIIRDGKEIIKDGMALCRPCHDGAYYTEIREFSWPDMNWAPGDKFMINNQQVI